MVSAIRSFFRWVWSLTPWGKPKPAPMIFFIETAAEFPEGPKGSLCLVGDEETLYMKTPVGWTRQPVSSSGSPSK